MKRKTLETVIRESLAGYSPDQQFRAVAHELLHDGEGWSSNDRFSIATGDAGEMIQAARARWEIFKVNYSPRARVADLADISCGDEYGVNFECDFLPFLDIEPV